MAIFEMEGKKEYSVLSELGEYLINLQLNKTYDKEKLKIVILELQELNKYIDSNYDTVDGKDAFLKDIVDNNTELNKAYIKVIESIK